MKQYFKYLILWGMILFPASLLAQTMLKGTVTDAGDGSTMPGVNVSIKGSIRGVITDANGNYQIITSASDVVIFSFVGYVTQEYAVENRTQLDVQLESDLISIDEVVVVGYGVTKKSDLTSSIVKVKGDDLRTMSVGNATIALQGKAPGVQVVANGGQPGSVPKVFIRGFTSLNLTTDPLYVVDGMPRGNDINFLNPNEIESIEVLKDASASAIYGSLASNGVIMITTKRGVAGKPVFSVDLTYGFQLMKPPFEMCNVQDYITCFNTANQNAKLGQFLDPALYADREATDWWNACVRKSSPQMNASFGVQGGTEKHRYSISVNYYQQDSFYKKGSWDKFTARVSNDNDFAKWVSAGFTLAPRYESSGWPSVWQSCLRIDPITPIYKPADQLIGNENEFSIYTFSDASYVPNPVAAIKRYFNKEENMALGGTAYIDIKPFNGLIFKSMIGYDIRLYQRNNFIPQYVLDAAHDKADQSQVYREHNLYTSYSWQNTLTYMKSFDRHHLTAMLGTTADRNNESLLNGQRDALPNNSEVLREINAGTDKHIANGSSAMNSLLSYFGRVNYNFDHRYYLTATFRRDGSSKFMPNNKWANFPSASAAWQISNEDFMKSLSDIVNSLKLRVGWGQVGNQNLLATIYESRLGMSYYVSNGSTVNTAVIQTLKNEDIKWETVEDINFGVDFGLWQNKLSGSVEYYMKNTKDMIFRRPYPYYSGFPQNAQIWANVGSMRSQGFEFLLDYKNNVQDFRYNVTLTFTTFNVTATTLADGAKILYGDNERTRTEEGMEPAYFYGYKADGIFQNLTEINAHTSEHGDILQPNARPGDIRFLNLKDDGVINGEDRTKIGSPWADFTAGLTINFEYKGVDLMANFYGSYGNDLANNVIKNELYNGVGFAGNRAADILQKAWHGEGTSNDIPILSRNDTNENFVKFSSFYIEDGSFLRMKNLQLGYTLPNKLTGNWGISRLRVYVSGQNLWTLTKFTGIEPEMAGSVLNFGFTGWNYPVLKSVHFGLNLNF